jgi:CRISPR-associated protein Cas2
MPTSTRRLFLLAYDIADRKRLARVHRRLKAWGLPLQYSVWLVPGRRRDIDQLCAQLDGLIDPAADDVRLYALPTQPRVARRGRDRLRAGIALLGEQRLDQAVAAFFGAASGTDTALRTIT